MVAVLTLAGILGCGVLLLLLGLLSVIFPLSAFIVAFIVIMVAAGFAGGVGAAIIAIWEMVTGRHGRQRSERHE